MKRPGFIYVLTHPSDSSLYKIGITVLDPKKRMAQHNRDFTKLAGSYVKETGQKWELKEFHPVPDPYNSEKAFWNAMPFVDVPFLGNGEVMRLEWEWVQKGLNAAKVAGVRAPREPEALPESVYRITDEIKKYLVGRDITLIGYVKNLDRPNTFKCSNGHRWRMSATLVAVGKGCPTCGAGERDPDEIEI